MGKQVYTAEDTAILRATLGARLKAKRRALRLTQAEMAQTVDLGAQFYGCVERGRALPSVEALGKMADSLDVSVDYLLGMDGERPPMSTASYQESRCITYVVERARHDPHLIRWLIALLKWCANRDRNA